MTNIYIVCVCSECGKAIYDLRVCGMGLHQEKLYSDICNSCKIVQNKGKHNKPIRRILNGVPVISALYLRR